MKLSRKHFLQLLAGAAVTAPLPSLTARSSARQGGTHAASGLKLGLASYSLRKFPVDEAVAMTRRVGLEHIAFKSMHMPLDLDTDAIRKVAATVREKGLDLYGAGVIYMRSEEQVDQAFAYAQAAGLRVIIGVPNFELLPRVEEWVKKTGIRVAIHNHGPGDKLYPTPASIHARIKDLDPRIGICLDVGHVQRLGQDPIAAVREFSGRIYDVHLKDVDRSEPEGENIELGRGVIDIPALLQSLREVEFDGIVAFEFEKDADDPLAGLAESVGYARGVLTTLESRG